MNEQGNQFFISDVVKDITGYEVEELIGSTADIAHPDDFQISMEAFAEILENKNKTIRLQYRHKHKEKGYVWLEAVGQNYLDNPLINAIIINTRDISMQKEIEFELKQAKEIAEKNEIQLKELNTTRDKLFSVIAHDLRSPFNSIIGFSELLLDNPETEDNVLSEKYYQIINSTAKETLILLDNLLNWALSQTGQLIVKSEKIILSEVILEIIALNHSFLKAKKILLNYSSTNGLILYTDANILKTILRNLISNAIKFTNLEGNINILVASDQNHVEIIISDNGVGMDKEKIDQLFNFSNNTTTSGTTNEKGSGLGLILCKEFVEKLGGSIAVKSEKGKGSDFKFIIPLCHR